MITIVADPKSSTALDARMAAFLAHDCPEVFHSVATPTEIWKADPYDVETIHAEARAAFEHILNRACRTPPPPSGAILVLQGEAGSGKTHLMRAFRTRAHGQGLGYCVYLQMTTEASNYDRYILNNLIDGLEQPYDPNGSSRTGLARLSAALLESVPGLFGGEMDAFRAGDGDATRMVDEYADRLKKAPRFRGCDLELLRVMLHLERPESEVHSRAMMWLRCQAMRPQDTAWIGGAIPRTDDADPMRMLRQFAKLTDTVEGIPLVLLIDQLEEMANQSAPVERFLKVVDAITAFTDTTPNSVVVLACLEDYYSDHVGRLTKSKHDRVTRDPEPIRLLGNRTVDEIREMAARRLGHLYDEAGVDVDPADELYPFRDADLARLNNLRARDALDYLRRHHQRCITEGRWIEPEGVTTSPPPNPPDPRADDLDALLNDFRGGFQGSVPDDEDELASVLAGATVAASAELPDGVHFECSPAGRYLEVETHRVDNGVDRVLVAVCNVNTRGPAFGKQLSNLEKRAGVIPVAIVRTTGFPKSGKAIEQIAGMLKRDGRKVVVADADCRRMLAFAAFRAVHAGRPDFVAWQRTARPLGELDSLQKILRMNALTGPVRESVARRDPDVPPPRSAPEPAVTPPDVAGDLGSLVFGRTLGMTPVPVVFDPDEFKQHAAFLGGTGSGKTTAALNLIEQLLARGIPAVLVDRKGDLCRYADRAAWDRALEDPSCAAERRALKDRLDVALFTPGEPRGRSLALPIVPPGFGELAEADRERFAQYAAAALGSMIGFRSSDADKGQRAILAKAIETLAAVPGAEITVSTLRLLVEDQDDALLNAIGGGYPDRFFANLAQRLLTLELNNKQLLSGDSRLDVDELLGTGSHARPGRVRLSVISTRFLGDAARVDFWVSQLLVAVSRWCAKSPRPRLQAVFLFDEADMYLPAGTRQPATKAPMEDLLKRARSAGVGIFLATQSPGDLDYRCKENVRTWLIGRVKEPTALEKLKPMFAAARGNMVDRLSGQGTGEFTLVRESGVIGVRSDESCMRTQQLAENEIIRLARSTT